jgi:hypothetical protein
MVIFCFVVMTDFVGSKFQGNWGSLGGRTDWGGAAAIMVW